MIHCRLRARLFLEFPPYINRILATVWKSGMDEVFVERADDLPRPRGRWGEPSGELASAHLSSVIPVPVTGIQPRRVCVVNESHRAERVSCAQRLGRTGFL
ncbi:hypothetical protein IE4803_CH02397 [Rhizobium etli bv. phaseoli str. IE4803]|nr:hypothetical protein IE4803_CH02397 [Rhizobium etli bv. phaseoli str. IE4803]